MLHNPRSYMLQATIRMESIIPISNHPLDFPLLTKAPLTLQQELANRYASSLAAFTTGYWLLGILLALHNRPATSDLPQYYHGAAPHSQALTFVLLCCLAN